MTKFTEQLTAVFTRWSHIAETLRLPVLLAALLLPLPMFFAIWEFLNADLRWSGLLSFCCALAATVTLTAALLKYIRIADHPQPELSDKASLLQSKTQAIRALSLQRYFFGAILVSLGIYIAYQAQQAIVFASGGSEYGAEIQAANQRLSALQAELTNAVALPDPSKTPTNVPAALTDNDLALRKLAAENISQQILQERTALKELYAVQADTQGSISTSFLFAYFSDFFVRVATLGVSISFFSILLGQYRRIEQRIARNTALKSALLLELGGWNAEAVKQNTPTMLVLDSAPKSAADDTEIALPKSVFQNIVGTITDLGIKEMVNGKDVATKK